MKYLLNFIFLIATHIIYAQTDAFASEVTSRNGTVYYQNKPLSGTLYSDDEIEIPNECQCTLKASYKNGKLNGQKKEWYNNGKLKFSGLYKNGLPVNEHITYNKDGLVEKKQIFENGLSIKEIIYYPNGKIKTEIPYKNYKKEGISKIYSNSGDLEQEVEYKNDEIIKESFFKNNEKQRDEFYEGNHTKLIRYKKGRKNVVEGYKKGSVIKEGVWKTFDSEGNLYEETTYENDKRIKYGKYKNNKKEGEWVSFSNNFKTKTVETYKDGKLIKTKQIDADKYLENFPMKSDDEVLSYYDENFHTNHRYYILRFNEPQTYHEGFSQINQIIRTKFHNRGMLINKTDYEGEKVLDLIILITPIEIKYQRLKMERIRIVNGKQQKYYVPYYFATCDYNIKLINTDFETIRELNLSADSSQSLGMSLLTNVLNKKPKTKEEALRILLGNISLGKINAMLFPIQATVKNIISSSSSRIKKVMINKGKINNIHKKMIFSVYDEDNKIFGKAKLKVIELNFDNAICRVIEGQQWLKNYTSTHTEIPMKETY